MGYDSNSASYRIFNKRTLIVETFVHVTFDESNLPKVENGSASDVDRITTDLEDLDLLKDDVVVPEPIVVDQVHQKQTKDYQKNEDGPSITLRPTSSKILTRE